MASLSSMRDFQILQKLGEGSFSVVYKVKRIQDQTEYALKKVKLPQLKEKERQNALNEVRLLASLDDQYIVAYKDAFIDDGTSSLCIVMELLSGGDLQKRIGQIVKGQGPQFSEGEIWRAMVHMARGLKTLHDANVVHRDLKCANVFLSNDGIFKLGDLNVSKVAKMGLVYTQTGTPYYASPEVWRDEPYDSKSDVWSLGCVLYEMATLKPPFRAQDMDGLFKKVQKGVYDPLSPKYSRDLAEIIGSMLRVKSNQRPSCEQLLQSAVVNKHCPVKDPTDNVAQLLKTIQLPKNYKQLNEKLPKARYNLTKDRKQSDTSDRQLTQQDKIQQSDIAHRDTSPNIKRPLSNVPGNHIETLNSQVSHSQLSNVSRPSHSPQPKPSHSPQPKPTPKQVPTYASNPNQNYQNIHGTHNQQNGAQSVVQSVGAQPRQSNSPGYNRYQYSRPQSYNPINHQPAKYGLSSRDHSPNSAISAAPKSQVSVAVSADNLNLKGLHHDVRSNVSVVKSKVEGRPSSKVEQFVPEAPNTEPIKRREPSVGVFPQQAKVMPKREGYSAAAGKPSRPFSSNIVPDHQINARQRQLVDFQPQYNIITNAPYNHYFPVEHINLKSQMSDPQLMKQKLLMRHQQPQYKLSEVQKYQQRRMV